MRILLLALLLAAPGLATAERGFVPARRQAGDHVALVIGNAAYPDAPLANPVNDATDVAQAFESLGFRVQLVTDADRATMLAAIERFGQQLAKARAAVFYYAGHGVQVEGANWLLPVARRSEEAINREDEVRLRAVNADEVLLRLERARVPVGMLVLDACRNNPFRAGGRATVKGLAQLNAPPGCVVVYAAAPGQVAADGTGRNSPFTAAFLKHLATPGLPVDQLLMLVRREVREQTKDAQVPWTMTSMTESFTFVPPYSPEEEVQRRREELARLQAEEQLLAEHARQRQREEAQLAAKREEIARLEQEIAATRQRLQQLGTDQGRAGDEDLLRLHQLARERRQAQEALERQQRELEAQRRERQLELEVQQLRVHEQNLARWRERRARLREDLALYREIVQLDPSLRKPAWEALLRRWQVGPILTDDLDALLRAAAPEPQQPAVSAEAQQRFERERREQEAQRAREAEAARRQAQREAEARLRAEQEQREAMERQRAQQLRALHGVIDGVGQMAQRHRRWYVVDIDWRTLWGQVRGWVLGDDRVQRAEGEP